MIALVAKLFETLVVGLALVVVLLIAIMCMSGFVVTYWMLEAVWRWAAS